VSSARSNACNPLAPRIDKNLGNPRGEKGGHEFYPSTDGDTDGVHGTRDGGPTATQDEGTRRRDVRERLTSRFHVLGQTKIHDKQ
jgi:hypothetical protein